MCVKNFYRFPNDCRFIKSTASYVKTIGAKSHARQGTTVFLQNSRKRYRGYDTLNLTLVLSHANVPQFNSMIVATGYELVSLRERSIGV